MPLRVGVPREVKPAEHRVAITPDGVRELVRHEVPVLVESGAGVASAITDAEYVAAGARIVPTADELWGEADLVCKVKEPQPEEADRLREGLVLFTYLHLAAYPEVAELLLERRVVGVAYETVQTAEGALPSSLP